MEHTIDLFENIMWGEMTVNELLKYCLLDFFFQFINIFLWFVEGVDVTLLFEE